MQSAWMVRAAAGATARNGEGVRESAGAFLEVSILVSIAFVTSRTSASRLEDAVPRKTVQREFWVTELLPVAVAWGGFHPTGFLTLRERTSDSRSLNTCTATRCGA